MIPALCCVCGTAREVSHQAITLSENRRLKCATCGRMTMHAQVLPAGAYDWREVANTRHENRDRSYDAARTQPPLPDAPAKVPEVDTVGDVFAPCRERGAHVFEVEGFPERGLYVRDRRILFVNAGMSPEDREWTAEWLLSRLTDR